MYLYLKSSRTYLNQKPQRPIFQVKKGSDLIRYAWQILLALNPLTLRLYLDQGFGEGKGK